MGTQSEVQIVWFKRDLRVRDHEPLSRAAERGPVLPLYVAEPDIIGAPDFSPRHWALIEGSLRELRRKLAERGQPLIVRHGKMPAVLDDFREQYANIRLWAHEETGNHWTARRDERVRDWASDHGVPFTEVPSMGVTRGLETRDGWVDKWEAMVGNDPIPAPEALRPISETGSTPDPGKIPSCSDLKLGPCAVALQKPGEEAARETLDSFLNERARSYHTDMSSPLTAEESCSRMSVHLAYGTISLRSLVNAKRERREELESKGEAKGWRQPLSAFESRLHWHSHFIQKLEDAPRIEHESFIPEFDELREGEFDEELCEAWKTGHTGFPMVDACMRYLRRTGWLNFRMRAMLTSFAVHHCWLDWRKFKHFYARQMADYEPGIHYPQLQMQSGTTGINSIRIYNPMKQAKDHDPDGTFIRRWVPELSGIEETEYVHEPWRMSTGEQKHHGCMLGEDYPERILDPDPAYRRANSRILELKNKSEIKDKAEDIYERHGSRK
ncbi:deoxyribodipyrimidine photo-lyase [Salinibacter ruber]|nr:deoxyribodipyrimidine photo-lyase [Salinibacter ruber]MCS3613408.1 deoxyribodipyrimidine photo-lyase [Salinibacter ruber]